MIHAINMFNTLAVQAGPSDYDATVYGQGNKEALFVEVRGLFAMVPTTFEDGPRPEKQRFDAVPGAACGH